MSDDLITNEDCIPTKELLKRKRKEAYENMKAQQKLERIAEKKKKQDEKKLDRQKRDEAILKGLVTGDEIEP